MGGGAAAAIRLVVAALPLPHIVVGERIPRSSANMLYDTSSSVYNSFLSTKGKKDSKTNFKDSKGDKQGAKVRGSDGKYQGE